MNKKLIGKIIISTVFLTTISLIISCNQSSEIDVISANRPPAANITPMNKALPQNNQNSKTEPQDLVDLSKAPTVSYCELMKNPARYDHKIVRVRAIYFTAFEKTYLYDERCEANQPPAAPEEVPDETWAEWDKSLVIKGDSDEAVLNRRLNGFGRKDVTVTGKFNSTNEQMDTNAPNLFGHMNCCRFQFQIMRVESVNGLEKKDGNIQNSYGEPVKFAPRQKIEFADFTLEFYNDLSVFVAKPQGNGKLPKTGFLIEKGGAREFVYGNNEGEERDVAPLKFEFGGADYELELNRSKNFGKLAADVLVIRQFRRNDNLSSGNQKKMVCRAA